MMKKTAKKVLSLFLATAFVGAGVCGLAACALPMPKDGTDGKDVDPKSKYEQAVKDGAFTGSYSEFLKAYLADFVTPGVPMSENEALSHSINASLLSVASVLTHLEYRDENGTLYNGYTTGFSGSAVAIEVDREKGDACFITNCHVIYPPDEIVDDYGYAYTSKNVDVTYELFLYGMEYQEYSVEFKVIGYSVQKDVAVIQVTDSEVIRNSLLTAAKIGDSDAVQVGEEAYLVGNALGQGISASLGIVSMLGEPVHVYDATGIEEDEHLLELTAFRTDAAANHGNSGGGFFNRKGELIGILFAGNEDAAGVSNCLPINSFMETVNEIRTYAKEVKNLA